MTDHALTPEAVSDLALAAVDAAARPEAWVYLCDLVADRIRAAASMVIAQDLLEGSGGVHPRAHLAQPRRGRNGTYGELPPGLVKDAEDATRGDRQGDAQQRQQGAQGQ